MQKTREGCGCFRDLLGGSQRKFQEDHGKIAGNFPRITTCFKFQDFEHRERQTCREPWVDTVWNLVQTFCVGCFWKSTVTAFSCSSEFWGSANIPKKESRDMGYHSNSITLLCDMGPLRQLHLLWSCPNQDSNSLSHSMHGHAPT